MHHTLTKNRLLINRWHVSIERLLEQTCLLLVMLHSSFSCPSFTQSLSLIQSNFHALGLSLSFTCGLINDFILHNDCLSRLSHVFRATIRISFLFFLAIIIIILIYREPFSLIAILGHLLIVIIQVLQIKVIIRVFEAAFKADKPIAFSSGSHHQLWI